MKPIFYFLFASASLFAQNRETSVAMQIEYGIYAYLEDSLGIKPAESPSDCDCAYTISSTFWTFVSNKERKSPTLDTDVLDWIDDSQFEERIKELNQQSVSKFRGMSDSVFVTVDIKRRWILPNPIGFDWKIRYDYDITLYLPPRRKETK